MELPPLAVLAAALEKMEKTAVLPTPDESTGSSRIQVSFQGWKCLWMEILQAGPVCPAAQMPFRVITVMQFSIMDCDTELLTHGLHSKFHCFTGKKKHGQQNHELLMLASNFSARKDNQKKNHRREVPR